MPFLQNLQGHFQNIVDTAGFMMDPHAEFAPSSYTVFFHQQLMNESAALRERLKEINAGFRPRLFSCTWGLVVFMIAMLVGFALIGHELIGYYREESMTRWAFRMLEERQLMECIRKKPWDTGAIKVQEQNSASKSESFYMDLSKLRKTFLEIEELERADHTQYEICAREKKDLSKRLHQLVKESLTELAVAEIKEDKDREDSEGDENNEYHSNIDDHWDTEFDQASPEEVNGKKTKNIDW